MQVPLYQKARYPLPITLFLSEVLLIASYLPAFSVTLIINILYMILNMSASVCFSYINQIIPQHQVSFQRQILAFHSHPTF